MGLVARLRDGVAQEGEADGEQDILKRLSDPEIDDEDIGIKVLD